MMAAVKSQGGLTIGCGMGETTRIMCAAIGASVRKLAGKQRSQLEHVRGHWVQTLKGLYRDLEKMHVILNSIC